MIPAEEQIEVPIGDRGEVFPAAVAIQWKLMFLEAPGGARFVGLALSPQPKEAVIAKMTEPQARKLALDLLDRCNAMKNRGSSIIMPPRFNGG
jgi:hypothetical protein